MKMEAYIRVVSNESAILAIHAETNIPGAMMKQLKARKSNGNSFWWDWATTKTAIDIENPDEGLRNLLTKYRPAFPAIRKQAGSECDIYLEVISEYQNGEEPRGLYLSPETLALLNELGGAFDNDVIIRD